MKAATTRKNLLWVIRVLISSGLLIYMFYRIPISEILNSIANANVLYLVLAVLLIPVSQWINAYRMVQLTRRQKMSLSTRQIFEINLITKFYGVLLPGGAGGSAIRWYRFVRLDQKSTQAFVSIAYNLVLNTLVSVAIGLMLWLLDGSPAKTHASGLGLFVLFLTLLLIYSIIFNRKVATLIAHLVIHRSRIPRKPRRKLVKLVYSLNRYAKASPRFFFGVLALFILVNLLGILLYYLLALSLEMEISLISLGWIRSYALVAVMLPISLLGLGVREATLVVLLAPFGVSGNTAIAFSFLLLAIQFILIGLGGLLEAKNAFLSRPTNQN